MKKKIKILLITWILIIACIPFAQMRIKASNFDKRAVWISYLDIDTLQDKSQTEFRNNFTKMCKTSKQFDVNTLIVQVRPFADAMYPSKYFHWSSSISSDNTNPGYDPLKIMVEIAHANGLKIEAWVNPYRISYSESTLNAFKKHSPIKSWLTSNKVIKISSTSYLLNPAIADVQNYIVNGISEIVSNYQIDGIHMDDYFYVSGSMGTTTEAQRKSYVNQLVSKAYTRIKSLKPSVTFGISPQGNIENCQNAGADVDTWLSTTGYVDYVMPQIYWSDYWGDNGKTTMFSDRLKQWQSMWKNKNVKLYAGLALYKVVNHPAGDIGWEKYNDNIKNQLIKLQSNGWNGYSYFQYKNLLSSQASKELENVASAPMSVAVSSKALYAKDTYQIIVNSINHSLTYSSSDPSVASVNSTGKVTANKAGTATITVKTSGGKSAVCKITVTAVTLTMDTSAQTVARGNAITLKASANNGAKISFTTSDSSIASVNAAGKVTANKAGVATITATVANVSMRIKITVVNPTTTAVMDVNGSMMAVSKTIGTNQKIIWSSKDSSVAYVYQNGKIIGKRSGKTYIYARALNGEAEKILVTIRPTATIVKLNTYSTTLSKGKTLQLKATVYPTGTSQSVTWKSNHTNIVTVDKNGKVSAKGKGIAYVTATTANKKIVNCKIIVK